MCNERSCDKASGAVLSRTFLIDQLRSIAAQFFLWLPAGALLVLCYWLGWINDQTQVPEHLRSIFEDVLDVVTIFWVLGSCLAGFGFALAFGAVRICEILNDECWRAFYAAGAFGLVFISCYDLAHLQRVISLWVAFKFFVLCCLAGLVGSTLLAMAIKRRSNNRSATTGGVSR